MTRPKRTLKTSGLVGRLSPFRKDVVGILALAEAHALL